MKEFWLQLKEIQNKTRTLQKQEIITCIKTEIML